MLPHKYTLVKLFLIAVASTCLCKFGEGFSFPGTIQMTDDAVDDAVAAVHVGEAGHGARSSTHFAEGALDDVGGAHLDPVRLRDGEKVQQSVEIALHTSHRVGAAVLPVLLPVAEDAQCFAFA